MLIDCFYFNDQLDILEIRLNELYSSVDKFVFFECNKYLGNFQDKEYLYEKQKERFKKFEDKIEYYKIEVFDQLDSYNMFSKIFDAFLKKIIVDYDKDDKIVVSCVEEIWKSELKNVILKQKSTAQLELDRFTCFYNAKCGKSYGARVLAVSDFKSFHDVRDSLLDPSKRFPVIKNSGWHFEYISPKEGIIKSIERSQYFVYWTKEVLDRIFLNIDNNLNPYQEVMNIVGMNKNYLPEFICLNKEKFLTQNKLDVFSPTPAKFIAEVSGVEKQFFKRFVQEIQNDSNFMIFGNISVELLKYILDLFSETTKIIKLFIVNKSKNNNSHLLEQNLSKFAANFVEIVKSDPVEWIKSRQNSFFDQIFFQKLENSEFFDDFVPKCLEKTKNNGFIVGNMQENLDLIQFFKRFEVKDGFFRHKLSKIDFDASTKQIFPSKMSLIFDLREKSVDFDELEKYLDNFDQINHQISFNVVVLTENSEKIVEKNNVVNINMHERKEIIDIFEMLIDHRYLSSKSFQILHNLNEQDTNLLSSLYLLFDQSNSKAMLSKYSKNNKILPRDVDLFKKWDGKAEYLIDHILNSEIVPFDISCYIFSSSIPIDRKYDEFIKYSDEYEHLLKSLLVSVDPLGIVYSGVPYVNLI